MSATCLLIFSEDGPNGKRYATEGFDTAESCLRMALSETYRDEAICICRFDEETGCLVSLYNRDELAKMIRDEVYEEEKEKADTAKYGTMEEVESRAYYSNLI